MLVFLILLLGLIIVVVRQKQKLQETASVWREARIGKIIFPIIFILAYSPMLVLFEKYIPVLGADFRTYLFRETEHPALPSPEMGQPVLIFSLDYIFGVLGSLFLIFTFVGVSVMPRLALRFELARQHKEFAEIAQVFILLLVILVFVFNVPLIFAILLFCAEWLLDRAYRKNVLLLIKKGSEKEYAICAAATKNAALVTVFSAVGFLGWWFLLIWIIYKPYIIMLVLIAFR